MNQDIVSNDHLPFIGEIKKDLYIATAFNAWGMTNGILAGKMLSEILPYMGIESGNKDSENNSNISEKDLY